MNLLIKYSPLFYFTQSLWRDEVYSIFVAQKPILSFIGNLSFEPPFYYILLHFWMLVFGSGEIATRSLSFVAFILATVLVIYYAERRFKRHWLAWYLPVFFFLNPMLLYYAFEVRTYGWYIFFATASMIFYLEKKWSWYIAVTTLGFYTHAYMLVVPLVQALHHLAVYWSQIAGKGFKRILTDPMLRALIIIILLISPWLAIIIKEMTRLKHSWYFPVDFNLVSSVLGNMFIGYEGTPWYGWPFTAILSKILLLIFIFALMYSKKRSVNFYFFLMIMFPLAVVIAISFFKPLFVNRYLIPVTIAQVFLISSAIESIRQKYLRACAAWICLLFVIAVDIWYPGEHPKTPSRDAMSRSTLCGITMILCWLQVRWYFLKPNITALTQAGYISITQTDTLSHGMWAISYLIKNSPWVRCRYILSGHL